MTLDRHLTTASDVRMLALAGSRLTTLTAGEQYVDLLLEFPDQTTALVRVESTASVSGGDRTYSQVDAGPVLAGALLAAVGDLVEAQYADGLDLLVVFSRGILLRVTADTSGYESYEVVRGGMTYVVSGAPPTGH